MCVGPARGHRGDLRYRAPLWPRVLLFGYLAKVGHSQFLPADLILLKINHSTLGVTNLKSSKEPKVEKRNLADLHSNPEQSTYFADLGDTELQSLAADIEANGLQNLIQVLPKNAAGLLPNTIVNGHQRRRALLLNGVVRADVLVRYDLAQADLDTIEMEFLRENVNRRQLDKLDMARVAKRTYEIERRSASIDGDETARDRVGKAIGMSGRNLARYWRLLQAPLAVQRAFQAGTLTLIEAERAGSLSPYAQSKIAERLSAGDAPRTVLSEYSPHSRRSRPRTISVSLANLDRSMRSVIDDFDGRIDRIAGNQIEPVAATIREVRHVLDHLLARSASAQD